jgi:hypothetical protein
MSASVSFGIMAPAIIVAARAVGVALGIGRLDCLVALSVPRRAEALRRMSSP